MTPLGYMLIFLGFLSFLFAVEAKFVLAGRDFNLKTDKTFPLWDRMVAGAVGIILLSWGLYWTVDDRSSLPMIAWASAAAITLPMVLYLLALWLRDWNEDVHRKDKVKIAIRTVLLGVVLSPLTLLWYLLTD